MTSRDESHLDLIISRYVQSIEAGESIDRDELLERHPEFAEELAAFFRDYEGFRSVAAPFPTGADVSIKGARLGDYEILDEIARGGMGIVYRARQLSLNRIVALKVIRGGPLASGDDVARFKREVGAAAALDHPNIVPVYETGEFEGRNYYSMRLVEGGSLVERTGELIQSPRLAASLIERVARALTTAHAAGVIHRDLKPANILIDPDGEPQITDFGLARSLHEDSDLTRTGALIGTPAYLAPELVERNASEASAASDVYSLGAVLYECLTGRPPFRGDTTIATLEQIRRTEPPAPRALNPGVDRDLETICLKCLEKSPSRRYSSARALTEDLARYRTGEAIRARPISSVERAWRWAKKRPALSASVAGAALTVFCVLVVMMIYNVRLRRALEVSRDHLYVADIQQASAAVNDGEIEFARRVLLRHLPSERSEDSRGFEWFVLARRVSSLEAVLLDRRADTAVHAIDFHPERPELCTGSDRGTVLLWDLEALSVLREFRHRAAPVNELRYTADGRTLIAASGAPDPGDPGDIVVWDVESGRKRHVLDLHDASVLSLELVDNETFASGDEDGVVVIWDLPSGKPLTSVDCRPAAVTDLAVTFGGALAVSGQGIFDPGTGARIVALESRPALAFDSTGRHAMLQSSESSAELHRTTSVRERWDHWRPESLISLELDERIRSIRFSRDGSLAVVAGGAESRGAAFVFDVKRGFRARLAGRAPFLDARFSSNKRWLGVSSAEGTKVWRVDRLLDLDRLEPMTHAIALTRDRRRAAGLSPGGIVVWSPESGKLLHEVPGSGEDMLLGFSATGSLLAVAERSGVVRLLDTRTWNVDRALRGHLGGIRALAFDETDRTLAVASFRRVRVWDLDSGESLTLSDFHDSVRGVAFAHGILASASVDGSVRLFDPRTGRQRRSLLPSGGIAAHSLAVSEDGRHLAVGLADGTARVWSLPAATELYQLGGHAGAVESLTFSNDVLATGDANDVVRLFDMRTGRLRLSRRCHDPVASGGPGITSLHFYRHDAALVIGRGQRPLRIWRALDADDSGIAPEPIPVVELRPSDVQSPPKPPSSNAWTRLDADCLEISGGGQGVSWGDFDDDGDPDLYLACDGPNRLLRNEGNGVLVDVTSGPLADPGNAGAALWGDLDGDGDLDLAIANSDGANCFLRNDGNRGFHRVTGTLGETTRSHSVALRDIDRDGDLDIHLSKRESEDVRLANDGSWSFRVLDSDEPGREGSTTISWADFNDDGSDDLFVARSNRRSPDSLVIHPDAPRRESVARDLIDANRAFRARLGSWGDYDNDGDLDLYIAHRAGPNALLRNVGDSRFSDVTLPPIEGAGRAGQDIGGAWGDYDNDGDLDLFLASNARDASRLFRNDGSSELPSFTDVTEGPLETLGSAHAAAWSDIDGDGDLDLTVSDWDDRVHVLRNELDNGNHWLHVRLRGHSNTWGVGARVRLVAGGRVQVREIDPGAAFVTKSLVAEFGLGAARHADLIEVRWPSGRVHRLERIAANRRIEIVEE